MAWDFAAEIHSLANYNADDASTTGTSGEVLSAHATQWLTDGAKEIINQLPSKLKAKCAAATTLSNSPTVMDMDAVGEILFVTRDSADSGGYQVAVREIPSQYGGLATDSTDLNYYGTVTDPVYWIDGNTSDAATLYVKPTPTANQTSVVHHISYPTVAFNSTTIVNFPDEAEYLVVLYAATKACLYQMNTFQTSTAIDTTALDAATSKIGLASTEVGDALTEINEAISLTDGSSSAIKTAIDAMATANAKFRADGSDPALFGDEEWYVTGSSTGMTKVKAAMDKAIAYIDGNSFSANYDLEATLGDVDAELTNEDIELAGGRMQQAQVQMNAVSTQLSIAQSHIQEWQASVQTLVSEVNAFASEAGSRYGWINSKAVVWQGELSAAQGYMATANGYIAETNARMGRANQKYTWYDAQYAKLSAEYARGLAGLKGGGEG